MLWKSIVFYIFHCLRRALCECNLILHTSLFASIYDRSIHPIPTDHILEPSSNVFTRYLYICRPESIMIKKYIYYFDLCIAPSHQTQTPHTSLMALTFSRYFPIESLNLTQFLSAISSYRPVAAIIFQLSSSSLFLILLRLLLVLPSFLSARAPIDSKTKMLKL